MKSVHNGKAGLAETQAHLGLSKIRPCTKYVTANSAPGVRRHQKIQAAQQFINDLLDIGRRLNGTGLKLNSSEIVEESGLRPRELRGVLIEALGLAFTGHNDELTTTVEELCSFTHFSPTSLLRDAQLTMTDPPHIDRAPREPKLSAENAVVFSED